MGYRAIFRLPLFEFISSLRIAKAAFRHISLSHFSTHHLFTYLDLATFLIDNMGKRHNRKRTRSRPRHRDGGNAQIIQHIRSDSVDTTSSQSTINAPLQHTYQQPPGAFPANHWHQKYSAWQARLRLEQEREQEVEMQRLRIFGGMPGDEVSLLEPMLKVVTDLFDGFTDYDDP